MRKKSKIKILKDEAEDLWKKLCLLRDDYTCQYCGSKDIKNLQVHHIISRTKKSTFFNVDNGITLCKRCHTKISLNPTSKTEFMIWYVKKYGIEKLEELQKEAIKVKIWGVSELEELINKLQKTILKLQKKEVL